MPQGALSELTFTSRELKGLLTARKKSGKCAHQPEAHRTCVEAHSVGVILVRKPEVGSLETLRL